MSSRWPIPDAAQRWVCDVSGDRLSKVTLLPGATSSSVALIAFETTDDELVLRLHTRDDWLAAEPDIAIREAQTLQALQGSAVVAPELVAVDPAGEFCGRPAVLMTKLPGHPEAADASVERLGALAAALRPLHAMAVPSTLTGYRPYLRADERVVPRATADPHVWRQAIEACREPTPPGPVCFIHRDFHAGNVLFGGARTGIVDWPNACSGPPEIDIAHCKLNLAMLHGIEVANVFAGLAGVADPRRQAYWDLIDCFDLFEDGQLSTGTRALPVSAAVIQQRLDDFVRDALHRLDAV